jgi:hypothetical protein
MRISHELALPNKEKRGVKDQQLSLIELPQERS